MEQVLTRDGSITFFNTTVREHYHTLAGGKEEAILKFAQPCIPYIETKKTVRVLDVCFGLGYNTAAALEVFWKFNPDIKIHVTAVEIDPVILGRALDIDTTFAYFPFIKDLITRKKVQKANLVMDLVVGDARDVIPGLKDRYDVILFDPFSRTKAPELWSREFLKTIADKTRKGGVLTTYSCARPFREDLKELGFAVKDGPVFGRRAPSTVALKT